MIDAEALSLHFKSVTKYSDFAIQDEMNQGLKFNANYKHYLLACTALYNVILSTQQSRQSFQPFQQPVY